MPVSAGSLTGVCRKPVPEVVKSAPRVVWNPAKRVVAGAAVVAPPPSQLISRRPDDEGPGCVTVVRRADRGAEIVDRGLDAGGIGAGAAEHHRRRRPTDGSTAATMP
jgi:hypothetical protein